MKNTFILSLVSLFGILFTSNAQQFTNSRPKLHLNGEWSTPLGIAQLPGTTDENRLGTGATDTTVTYQLTRLYPYAGKVDYTKRINISKELADKQLVLVMERTKPSTLWIDGDSIGSYGHIYAPHKYLLPRLKAGEHEFKITIDNSETSVPKEIQGSHAWTDATQTNWNGILGDFYIEALPTTYIENIQIYPDVANKQATALLNVKSDKAGKASLTINGEAWNTDETSIVAPIKLTVNLKQGDNAIEVPINMGENPLLWSEFHPALYKMNFTINKGKVSDEASVNFGMRKFTTEGTQFVLNGNKIFLRGKHDSNVFPLTGYGPMDVESWRKVFRIAKQYGINHYRCHSFTPPRAALQAADIEGIYFQIELPLWGAIKKENTVLNDFMKREGDMMLNFMGNHPSFMALGLGNELDIVDADIVKDWLADFRKQDSRHLYNYGSNNNLGWKGPQEGEDFFVTCRVGGGDGYTTHVRSSFAYVDAEKGGILNNTRPSTKGDYSYAISKCPRPVVGHETCQFQIYPDYNQIAKYTGVLYPYNLEIFRDRLKENHLTDQAEAFQQATGHFSVECYKADMEYAFRTPGFGGFQLLDLQDFPGQGSALVGILDAFMDSKGIVEPDVFYGFNAPLIPLALFSDYCWNNNQTLDIEFAISNYLESNWSEPLQWTLTTDDGKWAKSGVLQTNVAQGDVTKIGSIDVTLLDITTPVRLTLNLVTGDYKNYYHLWVYPQTEEAVEDIYVATALDDNLKKQLADGASVLLIPNHADIEAQSVGGMFTPDYWNYAMFKTISENAGREVSPGTLSILTDPNHPLFQNFPTENHSNWQWWSITRNARPMILDGTAADYKPLVQVIDNIERNHKLGLLYEYKVGNGKLLVCMANLEAIADTPEGKQFSNAILQYIKSGAFNPKDNLTWEELVTLFTSNVSQREIEGVKNESDYDVK